MCAGWERKDKNSTKWIDVETWLDSDNPHAKSLLQTVADFEEEIADTWERGSIWAPVPNAPQGAWGASLTRVKDGKRKNVIFASYPMQCVYTDDELAAVTLVPTDAVAV